jgi:hypothetical protein
LSESFFRLQNVKNDFFAGLPNVFRFRRHSELKNFPKNVDPVDEEERKFSKFRAVNVEGVTDAERGLHGRVQLEVGAGLDLNAIEIY